MSIAIQKNKIFLGLGSNITTEDNQPIHFIYEALRKFDLHSEITIKNCSAVYKTAPIRFLEQPPFFNAVVEIETCLSPSTLLALNLEIERCLGRTRDFINAPRTIDIDILLYQDAVINEPNLILPHPRMLERKFVLVPLRDLVQEILHQGTIYSLEPLIDFLPEQEVEFYQQLPEYIKKTLQ